MADRVKIKIDGLQDSQSEGAGSALESDEEQSPPPAPPIASLPAQHAQAPAAAAAQRMQGTPQAPPGVQGSPMPSIQSPATVPSTPQQPLCGVGMSFTKVPSGDIKITGIMPGSPAEMCEALQVGDVLVKVDNVSVLDKTQDEIIQMVLGPPGSQVHLTVQSQYGYPHVMTAPFQVLPFDTTKKKKSKKKLSEETFISPENKLYGGGTLPKGFEHLESLRSAQPYTTPSLSIRTITLHRALPARSQSFSPSPNPNQHFSPQHMHPHQNRPAGIATDYSASPGMVTNASSAFSNMRKWRSERDLPPRPNSQQPAVFSRSFSDSKLHSSNIQFPNAEQQTNRHQLDTHTNSNQSDIHAAASHSRDPSPQIPRPGRKGSEGSGGGSTGNKLLQFFRGRSSSPQPRANVASGSKSAPVSASHSIGSSRTSRASSITSSSEAQVDSPVGTAALKVFVAPPPEPIAPAPIADLTTKKTVEMTPSNPDTVAEQANPAPFVAAPTQSATPKSASAVPKTLPAAPQRIPQHVVPTPAPAQEDAGSQASRVTADKPSSVVAPKSEETPLFRRSKSEEVPVATHASASPAPKRSSMGEQGTPRKGFVVGPPPKPPGDGVLKIPTKPIMLEIMGAKSVIVKEVDVSASSLHSGCVMVLWLPEGRVFQWTGKTSTTFQRVKGLEVSQAIKDVEYGSRCTIVHVEEGQEDEGFWKYLGGKKRGRDVDAAQAEEEEQAAYKGTVFIEFGKGDKLGGMVYKLEGPLRRFMLKPDFACVVVAPARRAYVWVGRNAPEDVSKAAQERGEIIVKDRAHGAWIPKGVETQFDGWEGTMFRVMFVDWMTACGTAARIRDEGEAPIAVDCGMIAKRTNALLVDKGKVEDILLEVKGKKLVTVRKVPLECSSFYNDCVFVLSTKGNIYQWNGTDANPQEKTKAADMCLSIRDHNYGGRAGIKVLDADGPDTREGAIFWGKLQGDPSKIKKAGMSDSEHEQLARSNIALLKVTSAEDSQGDVMPRPYRHTSLQPESAFILAWKHEQLFVWTGNQAAADLKHAAFALAATLQKQWGDRGGKGLVRIEAAPQHGEPAVFRAHFQGWQSGLTTGISSKSTPIKNAGSSPTAAVLSPSKDKSTVLLEERAALVDIEHLVSKAPAQPDLITPAVKHDDGSTGVVRMWRVINGRLSELSEGSGEGLSASRPVVLASNSCYLLLYTFCPGVDRSQVRHVIYAWQGSASSKQDIASATLCMNEVTAMVKGSGMQDRQVIPDGKETDHFLVACGGVFTVATKREDEGVGRKARLLEVRSKGEVGGQSIGKAVEVVCEANALFSGSVSVVFLPDAKMLASKGMHAAYIWCGLLASKGDVEVARKVVSRLLKDVDAKRVVEVKEGKETPEFWQVLGGEAGKYRQVKGVKPGGVSVTRVFHVEMAGQMSRPREITLPGKHDLEESPSGACLIDHYEAWGAKAGHPGCVYLWYDERCTDARLKPCLDLCSRYLQARNVLLGNDRSLSLEPVIEHHGRESLPFTGLFHAWRRTPAAASFSRSSKHGASLAGSAASGPVAGGPSVVAPAAAVAASGGGGGKSDSVMILPLEALKGPNDRLLPGVDRERREVHLSESDFERTFGCKREEFDRWPQWKKTQKRRDVGLF